jgi:hypothetical protein
MYFDFPINKEQQKTYFSLFLRSGSPAGTAGRRDQKAVCDAAARSSGPSF